MIVRSFGSAGQFELTDWTEELLIVPNEWGTIGQLGLFQEEGVAEHNVTFEEITEHGSLIIDRARGERNNQNLDATRKLHVFSVPHFPMDDAIKPEDLQGKRAYGQHGAAEQLAAVRARKMKHIMRKHAWTLEYARSRILNDGAVYAPSGTVSQNWYTEFGVSQTSQDFLFGTSTEDQIGNVEAVIAHIQDNIGNGGVITGVVALCSSGFFSSLINHAKVQAAYTYYASAQEPMRARLAANGSAGAMHREFVYGGVRFIECRDTYDGNALFTAGECRFVPLGTDMFRTYFGPANKFGLTNTIGERAYLFEYESPTGDQITLQSESNFVNAAMRPAAIVRGHSSN